MLYLHQRVGNVSTQLQFWELSQTHRKKGRMHMKMINCLVLASALACALSTSTARAEEIYSSSQFSVGQDFNSGEAFGYVGGENAVITDMSTSVSYWVDPTTGVITLNCSFSITGDFIVDPTVNSPYLDIYENQGFHQSAHLSLTDVVINGNNVDYTDRVNLNMNLAAYIYRNDEHTVLSGYNYVWVNVEGAIPTWASIGTHVYENSPDQDWSAHGSFQFIVTAVPSPGAIGLCGIGSLIAIRRRRQG